MKVKHLLHCHLLISSHRLRAEAASRPMPALKKLLRWSLSATVTTADAGGWLCERFAVPRQQDWPTAAVAALADGLPADTGYWLHADPVYLHLLRDRIVLTDEKFADLAVAEAEPLVATLNQHFADFGIRFFAPAPDRWYARIEGQVDVTTGTRAAAIGDNIQPHQPVGPHARFWQQRLNEIHMLLHEHPVNQVREERGALPVNSVFLAGGGILPLQAAMDFSGVWSGRPALKGLAVVAGQSCPPVPSSFSEWLAGEPGAGAHLIDLQDVVDVEDGWLQATVAALRSGKLQSVSLHLAHTESVQHFAIPRAQCWKFWRRTIPVDFAIHD